MNVNKMYNTILTNYISDKEYYNTKDHQRNVLRSYKYCRHETNVGLWLQSNHIAVNHDTYIIYRETTYATALFRILLFCLLSFRILIVPGGSTLPNQP